MSIKNYNKKINYMLNLKVLLFVGLFFSFIYNINEVYLIKDFLVLFNILILFFLFPYFDLKYDIDYRVILFITLFILISQLSYIFNLTFISNLIEKIYSHDSEFEFTRFVNTGRNGGIYYNPNQASKYITMLIVIVFVILKNSNIIRRCVLMGLYFSLLITGSRTGLFIGLVIFLIEMIVVRKKKILSIVVFILFSIIYAIYKTISRSLDFKYSGSLSYKINVLANYLEEVILDDFFGNFLFGNFTTLYKLIEEKYNMPYLLEFGFDSEIGMLISSYGVLVLIVVISFYLKEFQKIKGSYILVIIPFIFWPITSTVLFSIKTSMLYLIILGWSVNKSKSLVKK
tara:strand:+ start:394 stop:1422 length:1029 start_codon:yes stop_codon:yes gene_type:complete